MHSPIEPSTISSEVDTGWCEETATKERSGTPIRSGTITCLSRRAVLAGGGASLALWGAMPRATAAVRRDPRLLTIVLRGGLDGLSLAAPVGDPAYAALRGRLALTRSGSGAGLPLDDMFVLAPAMPTLHGLFQRGEALIQHAVATPYRGRSHFDGQDVLESGIAGHGRFEDGWLNRAVGQLPQRGRANPRGLALGAVVPLIMRGQAPALSWAPKAYNLPLREATINRVLDLYAQTDPGLAKAFTAGLEIDRMASGEAAPATAGPRPFRDFVETAEAAARFLAADDGPRIGALSFDGWDTHANEGAATGQLANRLAGLDLAIKALADGLAPVWRDTVVVIVTEFGRTARANGTDGTDHGTGMALVLLGGAVAGGRIVTDWPGLADAALLDGRDLRPTADLRASLKGVLADHLGLGSGVLADVVFPDSASVSPKAGLVRPT